MNPGHSAGTAPSRIGRYEILQRIGKGAMGVVYSARDEMMDRVVAIKVMMADLEGEPDTRTRFYREAQAAGRLLHPNIITIYDIGEEEGRIYLVMELLKGETLADFLRRPAITIEQKVDLMVQTCEGLGAAHARGIVHRDVKPGNLFVLCDGTLKILDFGVARLASSTMTASGFIIGTPDYMSPEQARGGEIDQRSDVFSSGAVFYYVLSGRKPFAARDLPAVLRKVQSEPPLPLTDEETPSALARIVTKALAKDPAHRHQSMAELAAELLRFKRHYEAETRQMAVAARERYDSIQSLVREGDAMSRELELGPLEEPRSSVSLRAGHPEFVERAPELLLVPFARPEIQEIGGALAAEHEALEVEVAGLRAAHAAWAAARKALDEGRPDAADESLRAATDLPDTAAVRGLRARVQEAVRVERERRARLEALSAEADGAAAAERWENVLALCEDAASLGGRADFDRLRARAREALDRRERHRVRSLEQALVRAGRAVEEKRFEAAEAALEEARGLQAEPDVLSALGNRISACRRAAAEETARAIRAAEAISLARAEFHAGHRSESVAVLTDCLAEEPEAPGVQAELTRLRGEIRRAEDAERRRAEAHGQAAIALAALQRGDLDEAVRASSSALAIDPGHPEAARVNAIAVAGLRAQAEARERRARAEELVVRGRADLQAGALAKAARSARQALDSEAGNQAATLLLEEIARTQAAQDAAREQARLLQQEVKAARQALKSGRVEAARTAVDRALRLSPGEAEVLALDRQVADEHARLERARREREDETVALPGTADEDDTVSLAAASTGIGRLLHGWTARLQALLRR